MLLKKFKGHSGCKISLRYDEKTDSKFVRKVSAGAEYNSRLASQMDKQKSFCNENIKTPQVLASGQENNLFYFDMEYIGGVPLHNYVSLNSIDNILPILGKLAVFLKPQVHKTSDVTERLVAKVEGLRKIVPDEFGRYCDYCLDQDWSELSVGNNHGDLTFENIIIYRNEVYLIDFLDSFIDTCYIDYAKLFQDIILAWSWRNEPSVPFIKNICTYNMFVEHLEEQELEVIKKFLVLNMLRIVPYSDTTTLKFLQNRLHYLSTKFEI